MSRTPEEMLKAAVFDDFIYEVERDKPFPTGKRIKLRLPLPEDVRDVVFAVEYMVGKISALIVPKENAGELTERDCEIEFAERSRPGEKVDYYVGIDELGAVCTDRDGAVLRPASEYLFIFRYN